MKRTGTLEVGDTSGLRRNDVLSIGAEVVYIRSICGTAVKVAPLRGWHRAVWRVRRFPNWLWLRQRIAREAAREVLCVLRNHRLRAERDSDGDLVLCCRCGRRYDVDGTE